MQTLFIDGRRCGTRTALYDVVMEQGILPAHCGRNLDAIHDALCAYGRPLTVRVGQEGLARLGPYAEALLRMLEGAARANPHLTFTTEPGDAVNIRAAVPEDKSVLLCLYREFLQAMEVLQPDDSGAENAPVDEWIDAALQTKHAHIWVAETQGTPVGFARAQRKPEHAHGPYAKLSELYIIPRCRHLGLARQLVQAVEDWARGEGLPRIILNVYENNEPARRLYGTLGYGELCPISLHRIRMGKQISPDHEDLRRFGDANP